MTLERLARARPAADARGVDQDVRPPLDRERRVDRVPRGAGLGRDDRTLIAEQPVQQRGLADVRPSDDRQPRARRPGRRGAERRQHGDDRLEAPGVGGRHGEQAVDAGGVEVGEQALAGRRVDLVHDECDRLAAASQQSDEVPLLREETGRGVEHAHHAVGLGDGAERLLPHARGER